MTEKEGRSGALVFVTLRHRYSGPAVLAVEEEQEIVYREPPRPDAPTPQPEPAPAGEWEMQWRPDSVLLFRYSALTFNGHRIHYDHPYVTQVEGYPGLVVHGPLIATLLAELLRRELPAARLARFDYRAASPLFAGAPFTVNGAPATDGKGAKLWAAGPAGQLAMEASAAL